MQDYWRKIKTIPSLEDKKHLFLLDELKKALQGTEVAKELEDPDSNTSMIFEFNVFDDDVDTDAIELSFWPLCAFGILYCQGTPREKADVLAEMILFADEFTGAPSNGKIKKDNKSLDDLFTRMQYFASKYWFAFAEQLFKLPYESQELDMFIDNVISEKHLLDQLNEDIFPPGEKAFDADQWAANLCECAPWAIDLKQLRERVIDASGAPDQDEYDSQEEVL